MIEVAVAVIVICCLGYGLWRALTIGVEVTREEFAGRKTGPDPARLITPSAGSRFPGRVAQPPAITSGRPPGNPS